MHLKAGETWRFDPPTGHTVAWMAVGEGELTAPTALQTGDLVVFDESGGPVICGAQTDTVFVLGSGAQHPHDLFMEPYSVHTSAEALRQQGRL